MDEKEGCDLWKTKISGEILEYCHYHEEEHSKGKETPNFYKILRAGIGTIKSITGDLKAGKYKFLSCLLTISSCGGEMNKYMNQNCFGHGLGQASLGSSKNGIIASVLKRTVQVG